MQLPRQVTGPLCRHPAHPLPGGAWLKVGRAERGKREGRAAPGPRGRQRRGTEGRPGRRSQSPRENRWKGFFFSFSTIKEKKNKKWLQAKRLLIYTHTPELLGRPISSHAGTKGKRASKARAARAGGPLRSPAPAGRSRRAHRPAPAARFPPPGPSRPETPAQPHLPSGRGGGPVSLRLRLRQPLGAAAAASPPSVSAETPPPSAAAASRAAGHVTVPRDRRLPERTRGGWCCPLRASGRARERAQGRARAGCGLEPPTRRSLGSRHGHGAWRLPGPRRLRSLHTRSGPRLPAGAGSGHQANSTASPTRSRSRAHGGLYYEPAWLPWKQSF